MTNHTAQVRPRIVTFQSPSTAVVFTKNPSVMDSLCNHKEFATRWADGETPHCTCSTFHKFLPSPPNSPNDTQIHLDGDTLNLPTAPLTSIATGSLQNKIFPPKKNILKSLHKAFVTWHHKNSIPSVPLRYIEDLWPQSWPLHTQQLQHHISHKDIVRFTQLFPDAVEDKRATSLRIYCPCLYFEFLETTFADPKVFRRLDASPSHLIHTIMEKLSKRFKKSYPWSLGRGRELPNACPA